MTKKQCFKPKMTKSAIDFFFIYVKMVLSEQNALYIQLCEVNFMKFFKESDAPFNPNVPPLPFFTDEEKAEQMKGFLDFVKETLGEGVKEVKLSANLGSAPVCLTPASGMSFEMEKYFKKMNPELPMPAERILELNADHPAVQAVLTKMTAEPEKARDYVNLLHCQAQLLADLPLEDPAAYTELVCKLMQ